MWSCTERGGGWTLDPRRLLLGVDEAEDGADIGDLNRAVAVGGDGVRVGLCILRHGGEDDSCGQGTGKHSNQLKCNLWLI